jgi:hypothetical protein
MFVRFLPPLVAFVGLVASLLLLLSLRNREIDTGRTAFELAAADRAADVQRQLELVVEQLHSVVALFASSEQVTADEFRAFTSRSLERHPALRVVAWIKDPTPPPAPDEFEYAFQHAALRAMVFAAPDETALDSVRDAYEDLFGLELAPGDVSAVWDSTRGDEARVEEEHEEVGNAVDRDHRRLILRGVARVAGAGARETIARLGHVLALSPKDIDAVLAEP